MNYVTVAMIAAHAKKHIKSVHKAMQQAGTKTEKTPGVRGVRITERDANNFLRKQWPEAGPIPTKWE